MTVLYNLAKVATATTGTGTITLGSAVSGYLTFAQSGVQNGDVVAYGIRDGVNSEVGTGTYSSTGPTLTRSVTKSTNSNNPISLSGSAEVYITARSEDIVNKTGDTMTGALTLLNTGLKVLDTDASHTLSIVPGSNLTADRTLTWTTGDTSRNITLTGNTTIPATFPTSTTDNTVPRFDGAAGSFQTSSVAIDDSNNVTGVLSLDIGNTDTTISRASAGVIAVEGSNVLMASNIGSSVQAYSANLASLASNYTAPTTVTSAQFNLLEATNNGTNYLTLLPPTSIASNKNVSFQDVAGTVYVSNGTDVAVTDGGTGASDASTARSNLGCGDGTVTGSGSLVLANSPTLSTPTLGTPLAGTLTNCTGLPISTGVSGLGANVATFLASPSSANLASAVTNETGSGALVFGTSPTLTTPVINGFSGDTSAITIGTNQFVKDASGNIGIGTASPTSLLNIFNATDSRLTVSGNATAGVDCVRYSTNTSSCGVNFTKARGTLASPTTVATGDFTGSLGFFAYDGTAFRAVGQIASAVETYTTTDNVSGYLSFNTRPTGVAASLTERMRIDSSGNLQFNSGFGSVARAYGCRAWVNFNGTGTVAIRASANVTSITDNAVGDYTVNFTTAMPDANFSAVGSADGTASLFCTTTFATGSLRCTTRNSSTGNAADISIITASVFR